MLKLKTSPLQCVMTATTEQFRDSYYKTLTIITLLNTAKNFTSSENTTVTLVCLFLGKERWMDQEQRLALVQKYEKGVIYRHVEDYEKYVLLPELMLTLVLGSTLNKLGIVFW